MGREGDFAPYTDVVGTVLPLEDVNIKLNAVVLEEERLTLSFLVEMPEDEFFTHMSLDEVRMNGRKLSVDGGGGSGGDISGHKGLYFMTETLFLNKDMPMDGQIDLTCKIRDVYSAPAEAYKSGEPVEETIRRGTVDFSFTASGENLKAASKVVAQNMPLPMLDGSEAVVQKVTLNPFAQRMTLSLPVTEDFMAYEMRGLDNHGNPIIFTATYIRQEGDQNLVDLVYAEPIADDFGTYGSSISGSDFFETARAMTLGLYGAKMTSGKEPAMEALSEDIQVTWS